MKAYLNWLFQSAYALNQRNILDLVGERPFPRMLDLGCDDGAWTARVADAARANARVGVEVIAERAALARARGIEVTESDLSRPLPFADQSFDLVHANQVIEHVPDVDLFTAEAFRVLKPGGRVIFSTENGSSWHNVAAAALGWQTFSLTNVSNRAAGLGNPLSLLRGADVPHWSWTHKVIFNYRGLIEFMRAHGFSNVRVKGAGYHPLPAVIGRFDPRHAHFVAVVGERAKEMNK